MAVFTLETDDPSETVNPSSKPVSDGPSVSSVNTANGCDTRTKLWIFLSVHGFCYCRELVFISRFYTTDVPSLERKGYNICKDYR